MVMSAGRLEQRRRRHASTLSDTCIVTRVTRVRNDSGGWTETTVNSDAIACRLGPVSGRERVLGGRVVEESDAVLTLPYDADVRGSDRITHAGRTYEVVDIPERSERLVRRVMVRHA